MPDQDTLSDLLACPRCDAAPLASRQTGYRCKACKTDFPAIGGLPWLFADPGASLGDWRNRLHFTLQRLANEAQQLRSELDNEDFGALTRQRLEHHADAIDAHRTALRTLLAPLDLQSLQASFESHIALRTRLPADQGIHTYAANIYRDWSWGDAENLASLEELKAVLGDSGETAGDTLVLGAGAGRLAYDLHMALGSTRTLAMDFNPLLLIIAGQMAAGKTLELYEFPLAPRTAEDVAVLRKLSSPAPVRDGFHLLCGDVLRPPFAAASVDTVVTPWIIDIVDDDFPRQAARINRLLKPGGRWLNFGSLAFAQRERAWRYTAGEIVELITQTGFAEPQTREAEIPYLCSPASRHGRREWVFSFCATKTEEVPAPAKHKALPDWIVTGKEPVPLRNSFQSQAMSTRIHAFIMSLIDGQRTIGDMAKIMEDQKLMTAKEAEPAIRNFMIRMHEDAQR